MRKAIILILLSLILTTLALIRFQRTKRAWFRNLKGWQKLLGLVAVLMTIIVILNPELLVLGLVGDSVFFDMLVLALSVQMLSSIRCSWHILSKGFVRSLRWLGIPSPGFRYLMCVSMTAIITMTSAAQKLVHRIFDL